MARDYNTQCRRCTKTVHAGHECCHWCGALVEDDHAVDALDHLLYRVALLRDLTGGLSEKDKRALDAAYKNLDGVRRRRVAAAAGSR